MLRFNDEWAIAAKASATDTRHQRDLEAAAIAMDSKHAACVPYG
jgi:hypothetical protein